MSSIFNLIMTEHPAWRSTKHGHHRVFALADGGQWLVTADGSRPDRQEDGVGDGPGAAPGGLPGRGGGPRWTACPRTSNRCRHCG
jgi:hypothetical protein